MTAIAVEHISKGFGDNFAVKDVTFEVMPGEIFGLLGPNGSGKTTSIRVILDIYKPDSGAVIVLDGAMDEEKKNRIGYLPEERGLYQDIPLERCLEYLASLKNLNPTQIKERLPGYLTKFDLLEHKSKKIKELSKGMQQKAQLIATFIHNPEVIIIDEPFSALDPLNTQLVKDLLKEQRDAGKTIIMCTHQMNQVEQLCDKLVLINEGQVLLNGALENIREQYKTNTVLIHTNDELPLQLPGIQEMRRSNSTTTLIPSPDIRPQEVLTMLVNRGISINSFEIAIPTLDEIFIKAVQGG